MEDLVRGYEKSRESIRQGIKGVKEIKKANVEGSEIWSVAKWDESQLESMLRDITEIIGILKSRRTYSDLRGFQGSRTVLMDPSEMLTIPNPRLTPDIEVYLRNEIKDRLSEGIRERIGQLTIKQSDTLQRWIDQERTMSEIAREDNVSRQAVWVRLFGDKTNRGAIKILRGDDLHEREQIQD